MMFLTSSILLGFIRLGLIILFLFYLNRKFVHTTRSISFLDFIISNWFRYASLLLVIIFALIAFNAYNLFNTFFVLTIIIFIDIIGISNLKKPRAYFNSHIKNSLLLFLRNVENEKSFRSWFSIYTSKKALKKNNKLILFLTIFIGAVTFLSRYYFIIHDNYSLSDAWIYDLGRVVQFDSQIWFSTDFLSVDGEFALVNFYSKVTDVSPEIGLQVIAILESTILSVVIFWIIHKLTPSKFIAPIIASLSFAMVYVLTPINVYYLLKDDPTFMSLAFTLPIFVYYLRPNLLKINKLNYLMSFTLGFIAVGLIDLFTYCILIPPFLLIGFIFSSVGNKLHNSIGILSYLIATGILYLGYSITCYNYGSDLFEFFQSNLVSVSSYTYVPQLIFPYQDIIHYVQYATFVGFVLVIPLMIFKKDNWRAAIKFFVFFNFLVLLTYVKSEWIDIDMVNNSLSIFIPIILGFSVAIVVRIFNLVLYRFERFNTITVILVIIGSIYSSIYYQQQKISQLEISDQTPQHLLDAYDKISQTYFPYTYSVVNDPATQIISEHKHYFMNYSYFLDEYPRIDSVYYKNLKDPKFVVKNPEYAITKCVLVFVLNEKNKAEKNIFAENKELNAVLDKNLNIYRKRGRTVNLFYDSEVLKVYEIVNKPRESKVSDIIF